MNPAIQQLIELTPTLHGWAEIPKVVALYNLTIATKPQIVLEVGTWGGRSLFPMALALRQLGHGIAIAIDPWSHEASVEGQVSPEDVKWWGQHANHELVYQQFIHYVDRLGLKSVIEIHRDKSEHINVPDNIDIFHLDNNHGPQAYSETVRIAPKVKLHGYVVLDDLNWKGDYVKRAAQWLTENGFLELHPLGSGAVYIRIK